MFRERDECSYQAGWCHNTRDQNMNLHSPRSLKSYIGILHSYSWQTIEILYSGTEMTSTGAVQPEVQHQARKTHRISGCLSDTICEM
jgi:hypothetical protein